MPERTDRQYLTDPKYRGIVKRLRAGGFPDETIVDVIKAEEAPSGITGSRQPLRPPKVDLPDMGAFLDPFQVPSEEDMQGMRMGYGAPTQGPPAPPGPRGPMIDQYRAAGEAGHYDIASPQAIYEKMRGAIPEFTPPPGFEQPPSQAGPILPPTDDPKAKLLDLITGEGQMVPEEMAAQGPEMMPQDIAAQGPPQGPQAAAAPPFIPLPPNRPGTTIVSPGSGPAPAPTPLAPAPAPAEDPNQSMLQRFLSNPNLMEFGLRLMQASEPGAEHIARGRGPSILGAVGKAGLGTLASDRARKATAAKAGTEERRHREKMDAEDQRHADKMDIERKKLDQNAARITQDAETKRLLIRIDQENTALDRQLKMMDMRANVWQEIAKLRGEYSERRMDVLMETDLSPEEQQDRIEGLRAEEMAAVNSMKNTAGMPDAGPTAPASTVPTATNPQTGEKVEYRDGAWVPAP